MTILNGTPPAISGVTEQLQALIDEAERKQAKLRRELEDVTEELRPLKRALATLTGEPSTRPASEKPPPKHKDRNDWQVSPQKVEQVLAAMVTVDGPVSPTQLAREVEGLSPQGAGKAIDVLRQQGRVRLVGKTRGGGRLYAVIEPPAEQPQVAAGVAPSMWNGETGG